LNTLTSFFPLALTMYFAYFTDPTRQSSFKVSMTLACPSLVFTDVVVSGV